MNRARDEMGWEIEALVPRASLYFVVNQQKHNVKQAGIERCLQDPLIPSKDISIIVFQSELAGLKLFCSALVAQKGRLIGTETRRALQLSRENKEIKTGVTT
jgi:hypothetical protein